MGYFLHQNGWLCERCGTRYSKFLILIRRRVNTGSSCGIWNPEESLGPKIYSLAVSLTLSHLSTRKFTQANGATSFSSTSIKKLKKMSYFSVVIPSRRFKHLFKLVFLLFFFLNSCGMENWITKCLVYASHSGKAIPPQILF